MSTENKAPRVTQDRIESVIASEFYFTARQGARMAKRDEHKKYDLEGDTAQWVPDSLDLLTICVLILENGFTVTGQSACVSPENFDAEVGRRLARERAVQKIWDLEGYLLHQRLRDRSASKKPVAGDQPFRAGDVVRLKSGGPLMTVCSVDGDVAHCIWINGDIFSRSNFNQATLFKPS